MPNDFFVEVRASVRRTGPPVLVPLDQVSRYSGFRSVVAYDAATADKIRRERSTSDMRGTAVYADTLFVDFDHTDPTAFRDCLLRDGLAFQEYDSGNRSQHFHIPLVPVFGAWVPRGMKLWVQERAPNADLSFYHAAGQFRLPGTYHYKQPGRRKVLLHEQSGNPLVLPEVAVELIDFGESEGEGGTEDLFCMLTQHTGEGHRRPRAWRIATLAAEAGVEFDQALELMEWWNTKFCQPSHSEQVLRSQCEQAYRRVFRRLG